MTPVPKTSYFDFTQLRRECIESQRPIEQILASNREQILSERLRCLALRTDFDYDKYDNDDVRSEADEVEVLLGILKKIGITAREHDHTKIIDMDFAHGLQYSLSLLYHKVYVSRLGVVLDINSLQGFEKVMTALRNILQGMQEEEQKLLQILQKDRKRRSVSLTSIDALLKVKLPEWQDNYKLSPMVNVVKLRIEISESRALVASLSYKRFPEQIEELCVFLRDSLAESSQCPAYPSFVRGYLSSIKKD